ncbi:MAG: class I SAM-dependent methyltransferase [Pirellulales bacterium]
MLRRELSAERTHLIVEQVELRRRARVKFSTAERMFFTRRALEQATDEVTAAYKALRYDRPAPVFDLCCGIGGDLLALAEHHAATGVDRDPVMAILAEENARAVRGAEAPQPAVCACDVFDVDVASCAAWHIDPDRRPLGRRTTRVELHEPGIDTIERLLARNANAAIKLAPAAEVPDAWLPDAELEWISRDGECRQLVAWLGTLALRPAERRATMLGDSATPLRTIAGRPGEEPPPVGRLARYVFEPDAAVLAAGLGTNLAGEHDLSRLSSGIAYWTGDAPLADNALECFEVDEVLALDIKRLRALLRKRGVGRLEIKKRGVDIQPEALRRELRLEGDAAATLIVTRIARRVTAILVHQIDSRN